MEQCGKIRSVKGRYAEVEVMRSSACESCSSSHICLAGRKQAVIRALNSAGGAPGDRVKLETPSRNVLGYAFCVFVFPIIAAVAAYLAAVNYVEEKYALIAAVGGFALAFLIVFLTLERSARKRGGVVVITEIEVKGETDVPNDLEDTI